MNFNKRTVIGLFDTSQKSFVIPVYQRAYSWDKEQWKALIDDLKEQIQGANNYFFGNILLETLKEDIEYEVIDGQQRLTTITILRLSNFIAHKTLLILCCNGKENTQQKAS